MRIGYYAHHHGSGHCRQADKLAALLTDTDRQQMTVFTSLSSDTYRFTSLPESQIIRLSNEHERDDDVLPGRAGDYWQPSCLHYSPIGNTDILERSHQLLNTIYQRQIDLMIIDVSVEVAMLCRVSSIPYLYVRLPGSRDDIPHINAFAGALALLAPYPPSLESSITPDWVGQKTLYLNFINFFKQSSVSYPEFISQLSNHVTQTAHSLDKSGSSDPLSNSLRQKAATLSDADSTTLDTLPLDTLLDLNNINDINGNSSPPFSRRHPSSHPPIVTVIKGYGGHEAIDSKLPELRSLLPDAIIISLGPINDDVRGDVDITTHVDDVMPFIEHSDCVIMACGLNAIAQVYPTDTPLVVIPDSRPHREQEIMAEALIAEGRALSWQQFIKKMTVNDKQEKTSLTQALKQTLLTEPSDSLTAQDTQSTSSKHLQTRSELSAAKAFMQSTVEYTTCKSWFENWLLPQLDLKPDRLSRH